MLLRPVGADGNPAGAPSQVLRGSVSIEAEAASPLARLWRNALAVAIRETGF